MDFSAMSPLGNHRVLKEEIGTGKLIKRAAGTALAAAKNVFEDFKYVMSFLYQNNILTIIQP